MHTGLKHISLSNGWAIRKAHCAKAALMGKEGLRVCAFISCVGDDHWDVEDEEGRPFHEVLVYSQTSAREASHGWPEEPSTAFRFYYWNDLTRFLKKLSKCNSQEEVYLLDY